MEPLASKIRPQNIAEYIGQSHLVGPGKPLAVAIEQRHLFSFILWGPPGVGKTTLARIYAKSLNAEYHELSAVSAGKDDIRAIVDDVNNVQGSMLARPKILFLDEIHRFNKAQQDFLLPYVESGKLILIGATTENPSFEVIPALLSRCRVFVLNELTDDEMRQVIVRTGYLMDADAIDWLVSLANGDARQAITMLENTAQLYKVGTPDTNKNKPGKLTEKKGKAAKTENKNAITVEHLKNTLQSKFLRYDKKGEEHYNTISAFIKSMRASQPDAAMYYLARMIDAGEDPKFIARRMVIFASEDIGLAQPTALVVANAVFQAVDTIGMPEAGINLAHGVAYLSKAPKTKSSYYAYQAALADAAKYGNLPIPLKIRNAPTKLMKDLKYGEGYEKYTKEDLLPEKLKGKRYFEPEKNEE